MKLKFSFALCLIAVLTGCGGQKECDDSVVLDHIEENTLKYLQSYKVEMWRGLVSREILEASLAKVKEDVTHVEISDVFNFRKHENGTRTCKAKLTMQSLNGEQSVVMEYNVINYEDGHQVEIDDSGKKLVGSVIYDYVGQAQMEVDAIEKEKSEAKAAAYKDFLTKAPQGNVCADHFDQTAFTRDHVDMDLSTWVYEYDEALSQKVKDIVASSTIRVADIQTYGEVVPSDDNNLDTSKYLYSCKGALELTLPDGTVDANDQTNRIYFHAYAESQGNQLVSYRHSVEGEKFNIAGPARSIARKLKHGY